jgi:ribosomal protein S18 acetylase RimI-like enzyme
MSVQFRPYDPSDFEALYAIDHACYPRGIAYSRSVLRWFLKQPGADCLVAESDLAQVNGIVGFIIAESNGDRGHIITLDVARSRRRTGVGSALLSAAEQRLAARGVRSVFLETATSNEAAIAFWWHHGYRSFGVLPRYYLGRVDAYAMRKILTPAANSESPEKPPETPRNNA